MWKVQKPTAKQLHNAKSNHMRAHHPAELAATKRIMPKLERIAKQVPVRWRCPLCPMGIRKEGPTAGQKLREKLAEQHRAEAHPEVTKAKYAVRKRRARDMGCISKRAAHLRRASQQAESVNGPKGFSSMAWPCTRRQGKSMTFRTKSMWVCQQCGWRSHAIKWVRKHKCGAKKVSQRGVEKAMKALERSQKEVVQLKRKGHLSTASHTTQECAGCTTRPRQWCGHHDDDPNDHGKCWADWSVSPGLCSAVDQGLRCVRNPKGVICRE